MASMCCRAFINGFRSFYVTSRAITSRRNIHLCSAWYGKLVQFNLSDIGEGIAEVQVKEWHVKAGDRVNQFDNLCEVQSDKASVTITSRYDGVIRKLYYGIDDIAPVGQPLVDIELDSETAEGEETESSSQDVSPPSTLFSEPLAPPSGPYVSKKALATPAVRRIAMEHKVNLSEVSGTGKDGRVLKEDILRHIGAIETEFVARPSTEVPGVAPRPVVVASGQDQIVPIRGYTRIMFKTMTLANEIPHFGYCDEVCVDRLVDLREQLKSLATRYNVKSLSYMPLFLKAASMALLQFPLLNSSIDENQENLIYKASHNMCVAIDTPGGLIVPNIKNCEQRNLWEIASELIRLQEAALKQQVDRYDLHDGTITLSNIGTIGGTYAHPVIFPPQVCIGALGKMQVNPRFNDKGEIIASRSVKASWAADHRVIDGATMARFSNVWKRYLENPALMISELR